MQQFCLTNKHFLISHHTTHLLRFPRLHLSCHFLHAVPVACQRARDICAKAGAWLLVDNTYEYFVYGAEPHCSVEGDHVLNVFSFSKAFGMMGWRIGYIAYPRARPEIGDQLLKAQDTIVICPTVLRYPPVMDTPLSLHILVSNSKSS